MPRHGSQGRDAGGDLFLSMYYMGDVSREATIGNVMQDIATVWQRYPYYHMGPPVSWNDGQDWQIHHDFSFVSTLLDHILLKPTPILGLLPNSATMMSQIAAGRAYLANIQTVYRKPVQTLRHDRFDSTKHLYLQMYHITDDPPSPFRQARLQPYPRDDFLQDAGFVIGDSLPDGLGFKSVTPALRPVRKINQTIYDTIPTRPTEPSF